MADVDVLRYPVGPMQRLKGPLDDETRERHIRIIEEAPDRLRTLVSNLPADRLALTYRPGGWSVRQVVHHIADSHINAYVRMKLAATEAMPTVKSYEEGLWAELPDAKAGDVEVSLVLLAALHTRWVAFLRGLAPTELHRAFRHYQWGDVPIEESITMYSWHCRHHTAHIELALGNRR